MLLGRENRRDAPQPKTGLALIETRTQGSGMGEPEQLLRYQYADHLGSASLELDEAGAVISFEEYYPFGSTLFQSGRSSSEVSLKRYRYTGKERDEETGFNYHGARYYAPWLLRWMVVDPLESKFSPLQSPYNYCFNNPIGLTDKSGMGPGDGQPESNTWFIDSASGRLLGELPNYKDSEKPENYSLADQKINLRAISKLDYDDIKSGFINASDATIGNSIFVDAQKISDDLFAAVSKHFGEDKTYKEQEVAIFFDANSNKITSELLPDAPNENHKASIHSFLTGTRDNDSNRGNCQDNRTCIW